MPVPSEAEELAGCMSAALRCANERPQLLVLRVSAAAACSLSVLAAWLRPCYGSYFHWGAPHHIQVTLALL